MQTNTDIDYKNNLFEHPELTRLVGEPSTATLITLQAEIRDNAQSVQSDLAGGEHGHLGLVCTPEAYHSLVPNAPPYVRPVNPGRLVVDERLTQYQIAQVRDEHAESTRVFREVLGVERAIIQQMVVAIEPKFLRALRTPGTNKLTQSIPDILTHLFTTYGDVTPQDLRELTSRVENLTFPPSEPVDTIFSEIDDLAAIAEIASAPITSTQKVNMAYIHFQKLQIFKTALHKWDEKPAQEKSWDNFKLHLRAAHKALRRTGALTIEETLNREELMNLVTDGMAQAFSQMQPSFNEEAGINNNINTPSLDNSVEPPAMTTIDTASQSANATTVSDLTVRTLQRQMDMLQTMMNQMQGMSSNNNPTSTRRGGRARHQNSSTTNPNQCKYCWTHGLCNHYGRDCRTKADGHQDNATKENRMDGSMRNIPLADQ